MTIYIIILVLVIIGVVKYDLNKVPFVSKEDEPATNLLITVDQQSHPQSLPVREGSNYSQADDSAEEESTPLPQKEGLGSGFAGHLNIHIRLLYEQPWSEVLFYTILVILIGVSTFGYKMGSDTAFYEEEFYHYHTLFNLRPSDFFHERYQPGWVIFQSACRSIFDSYYFMKFIFAVFVNTAVFLTIRRYTRFVFFGILFYCLSSFLYFNFEILRQAMGIAIFLLAYSFVLRRKWHYYFLCVLLAYSMHNSAAILMFVPLFHTFDRSALAGILLLCLLVFFNSAWLGQTITEFMASDLLANTSASEYLAYDSTLSLARIRTYLILFVFPVVMLLVFRLDGIKIRYYATIMFYAITVIATEFVWALFRLQQYFTIFVCIFYVESFIYLARRLTLNYRRIVAPLLMSLIVYVYIASYFAKIRDMNRMSYERYFPYTSVFNKEQAPYRDDMR